MIWNMDEIILYGIQDTLGNPFFDAFLPYFTFLGEAGALWVVIGVCMLFSRKWRFWGMCLLASLLCVLIFNELGLKHLVGRVRPYIALGYDTLHFFAPTSYSFPSGHAGCAFTAATIIAFSPAKKGWKALVWVVAIAIAFSRLYLFVHYPSDVLVGAVLGTIYAIVVVRVGLWLQNRRDASAGKHAIV